MGGMINANFYQNYVLLLRSNSNERAEFLERLINQALSEYNINFIPKLEFNTNQDELGSYDPYENILKVFNIDFLTKQLTNQDMYEIIEAVLHELLHVKQYEEYLKNKSSYPGFMAVLPMGYGYFLQKEEDEAFKKTFENIQNIISSKTNTIGKEKEFYDGLAEYLSERQNIFYNSCKNEIANLQLFYNEDLSDKEKLCNILVENKKFLTICLDVKDIENHTQKADLIVSKNQVFRTENNTITNSVTLFFKNNKIYGKVEKPGEFDKGKIYFKIENDNLAISNAFNLENDIKRLEELSYSVFQVKDFYEKEFDKKLNISTSNYNINFSNELYKYLVDTFFKENKYNLNGIDIQKEFRMQKFKKDIKLFLNNEKDLESLLNYIKMDKETKELIYKNQDKFKRFLLKSLNDTKYDNFFSNFENSQIKEKFKENKLETLIENNVIQKVKNIFIKNNNIDKDDR